MRTEEISQVLGLYNTSVSGIVSQLAMTQDELHSHIEQRIFGDPATLTASKLLQGLLREALRKGLGLLHEYSSPFPSSKMPYKDVRWKLDERPLDQCRIDLYRSPALNSSQRLVGNDPIAGITLLATPCDTAVQYTGEKLFNDFIALDVQWTLRDEQFRCVKQLPMVEAVHWQNQPGQRQDQQLRLSLYPSPDDREQIKTFTATYGPDFLPSAVSVFLPEDQAKIRWTFLAEHGFILYLNPEFRQRDSIDYFSEWNLLYQTFATDAKLLLGQRRLLASWLQAWGPRPQDLIDRAVKNLQTGLGLLQPALQPWGDGKLLIGCPPTCGLQSCYATLLEKYLDQSDVPLCALPSCQRPFIPKRRDQTCCCQKHSNRLRVLRSRRKD